MYVTISSTNTYGEPFDFYTFSNKDKELTIKTRLWYGYVKGGWTDIPKTEKLNLVEKKSAFHLEFQTKICIM